VAHAGFFEVAHNTDSASREWIELPIMPTDLSFSDSVDSSGTIELDQAYIVLREDGRWRDVYRLVPGIGLTIGRDPGNRLIIPTEKCSRRHCEINGTAEGWILKDLGSSNGTQINGSKINSSTRKLQDGDVIRVAGCELLFTSDLTRPMVSAELSLESCTSLDLKQPGDDEEGPSGYEETEILKEKQRSRYAEPVTESNLRRGFSGLYRLVSEMVSAPDQRNLAAIVLDGLFDVLHPDIGAVLLLPEPVTEGAKPDDLRLFAWRAPDDRPYHRVSDRLSAAALKAGNGTLAMNVARDPAAGAFQTLATMNAQSVICAPIRNGTAIYGLIHLYCLTPQRALDDEALDFALAVAQHMAGLLERFIQQEKLAAGLERVTNENRSLRQLLSIEMDLIGASQPMQRLRNEIARIAATDSTTLIRGESGVGKELVARAIHFNSPRRAKPYICMNCAALTESLLESELFGHEKGAFTGATERKAGRFEQAHGGTLFLDEVGEMSLTVQTRFLRVLEGHPFERVGGHAPVQVDVRVVAATNRDLAQAVRDGQFRKDLFFRLNILDIEVPPLRERQDDIEPLATHFLELAARRHGRPVKRLSAETLDLLRQYDWPGNVRELRNVIERACAMAPGDFIGVGDIRLSRLDDGTPRPVPEELYEPVSADEMERRHIEATLRYTKWVKREAARILGIERSTLDRKLKSYGIDRPDTE